MALSATEAAQLQAAVTSCNSLAATVEEVLQLIRNAGNTGAVDIAAHNNSATAHSGGVAVVKATNRVSVGNAVGGSNEGVLLSAYPNSTVPFVEVTGKSGDNVAVPGFVGTLRNIVSGEEAALSPSGSLSLAMRTDSANAALDGTTKTSVWQQKILLAGDDTHFFARRIEINLINGSPTTVFEASHTAHRPYAAGLLDLGTSVTPWKDVYAQNAPIVTSDKRQKRSISPLALGLEFVERLKPVSFRLASAQAVPAGEATTDGEPMVPVESFTYTEGKRTHMGFLAQDVRDSLAAAGVPDYAVWCLADPADADSKQSLRYEELIAPLTRAVQELAQRVRALENKA